MKRRDFLATSAAMLAASSSSELLAKKPNPTPKFRKSLKWNMVKDRSGTLTESFTKLRECGYEGIEPNVSEIDDVAKWTQASSDSGLLIDGLVNPSFDALPQAIDLCKEVGGTSILVVCRYNTRQPFWESYKSTQHALKEAAPYAEKNQVKLLVENVWATFLISPLDMLRFIDEIDHPAVGVHFDVGNVVRWGVPEHWIEVLGERIVKLDIKEYDLKIGMNEGMRYGFRQPLGEGTINWKNVRTALDEIPFSGWAAAEVASGDWEYLADVAQRMDRVLGMV